MGHPSHIVKGTGGNEPKLPIEGLGMDLRGEDYLRSPCIVRRVEKKAHDSGSCSLASHVWQRRHPGNDALTGAGGWQRKPPGGHRVALAIPGCRCQGDHAPSIVSVCDMETRSALFFDKNTASDFEYRRKLFRRAHPHHIDAGSSGGGVHWA